MVLKRCVDVDDLLATATSGQADVAVVGLESPGLDPAAVAHLRRYAVRPVAVVSRTDDPDVLARAARIDVRALAAFDDPEGLVEAVTTVEDLGDTRVRAGDRASRPLRAGRAGRAPGPGHRLVAVWGPGGAPGRTTTAVTVASLLARRGRDTVLVDARPLRRRGGPAARHPRRGLGHPVGRAARRLRAPRRAVRLDLSGGGRPAAGGHRPAPRRPVDRGARPRDGADPRARPRARRRGRGHRLQPRGRARARTSAPARPATR